MKNISIHIGRTAFIILCVGMTLTAFSLLYVALGLRSCPSGMALTALIAAKLQLEYALATLTVSIGGAYLCDLVMNIKGKNAEK